MAVRKVSKDLYAASCDRCYRVCTEPQSTEGKAQEVAVTLWFWRVRSKLLYCPSCDAALKSKERK